MGRLRHRGISSQQWEETEIEDKPLSIVCHKGDMVVESDEHITLTVKETQYHGERVVKIDPVAQKWIEYILGFEIPDHRTPAVMHVIGFVDLPIKLMQKYKRGLPFFLKEPETFLHPSQQACIGDFLAAISQHVMDDGSFDVEPPERRQ